MKKKLIYILALMATTYEISAIDYTLKLGLSPYRNTTIREDNVYQNKKASIGLSLGGEATWKKEEFAYGFGFELQNTLNHEHQFLNATENSYTSFPIYLVGKYDIKNDYYALLRIGQGINSNEELVESLGHYLGFGFGKRIGNYSIELLYEVTQLRKTGELVCLEHSDYSFKGLFCDGALDVISLKFAYTFGKEEKVEVVEKIENQGIEEELRIFLEKPSIDINKGPVIGKNLEDAYIITSDEGVVYTSKLIRKSHPNETINDWQVNESNVVKLPKQLIDGEYTLVVRTLDRVNDLKSPAMAETFIIDNTGPDLVVDNSVEEDRATWNIVSNEDVAKVEGYLDGEYVELEGNSYSIEGAETGRYELVVRAYDDLGNMTEGRSTAVIVKDVTEEARQELVNFADGLESLPVIVGYKANITQLTPEQLKKLNDASLVLDGLEGTLLVVGYTDSSGSEELNLKLSKERAEKVKDLLEEYFDHSDMIDIETEGRGETNFTSTNETIEGRRLNRRIEFEFIKSDGSSIKSEY